MAAVDYISMTGQKKQLFVLFGMALLMSVIFLNAISGFEPGTRELTGTMPDRMMLAFMRSMPVILFGIVLFWWFGKQEQ